MQINNNLVEGFNEKPIGDGGWVNGGFFVLNPSTLSKIKDDQTIWEKEPLESLSKKGN